MKKIFKILGVLLVGLFAFSLNVHAESKTTHVDLSDLSNITEYSTLEEFLQDYQAGSLPDIYVTDFLFDGVSSVKTPDLDDFVADDSNSTKVKTLDIKVININTTGNIEFTGEITGAMIGVDTNNKQGEINLILNNATIDTDSKKAPAVYVYNKDKNYTDVKVTIKTLAGTKNYLEGGKLKKVNSAVKKVGTAGCRGNKHQKRRGSRFRPPLCFSDSSVFSCPFFMTHRFSHRRGRR